MVAIANIFSIIFSWSDFFSYANKLKEKEKGDIFENLTKLILVTKPEYNSILRNVWLYNEIPNKIRDKLNLPSRDEGIDLVTETIQGQYWAIQCKFKGQNQSPTYKELSTFTYMANNYCKNISLALLVHTGERGVRKRQLLGEKYSEIGLEFWLGLKNEDWIRIHKSLKHQSFRPKPRFPRPHQQKAIEGAIKHYIKDEVPRGRLLMPCGTGKSLAAFWIANAIKAKSIIVAVPSLSLIKQSLEDWTREFIAQNEDPRPEWLVICSDESTAKLDKDEFVSEAYSLGIPTTTDIDEISSFLLKDYKGRKIIFTTYQSSDKLAQAARKGKYSFDLAILDEAHKTVGVKSKTFATLLFDKNIHVARRLFMTATEKVIRGDNEDILSMDDPDLYGDLFYQLSFKEAIHENPPIISDYKILTITVTNDEIWQLITKNKLITDHQKQIDEQESQSLAAAIALRKAIQKYGIRHAISFHRSIKGAYDFSELNKKLNAGKVDNISLRSEHISSKKSAGERARLLTDFINENPALMTNARCLTEGVDVPSIDCVLFADPKQSIIDIVQSSGRALRPYTGKEFGYIMLPLIVPEDVTLEEFTDTTPFKEVARIVAALSTQDEMIAEEFRTITSGQQSRGRKIIIDGNIPLGIKLDLKDFVDRIYTKIWERVAKVNWRPFVEARAFVHKLNLKSWAEWDKYCQSGKKPNDIPLTPSVVYKDYGWAGMGDWLGTFTIAPNLREYRAFEEARAFVHELHLKSGNNWFKYCHSGEKPDDIPVSPSVVYKDNGWAGMGDWLGTFTVAPSLREYRPFEEARNFVFQLKLKGNHDWRKYCKSGEKPEDIPANPDKIYLSKGWLNWGDWLGTGTVAPFLKKYRSFEEARAFTHKLHLKSGTEWRKYCKSGKKPDDISASPAKTYLGKGWSGMGDWLGTGTIAPRLREYRPFKEARAFVHKLNLKSGTEWNKYCQSGEKPIDIPSNPDNSYKSYGWLGIGDWLGTGTIATQLKIYRPFEEARAFVHKLGLKSSTEWLHYCKSGKRPDDIPSNPDKVYKNLGWKRMGDWLGTGTIAPQLKKYCPFEEARAFVHKLELISGREWREFCKSGNKPIDIPTAPDQVYKRNGWLGMGDWLGTGTIAPFLRVYRPFAKAKKFVHKLRLKNTTEWRKYCRAGDKPNDIPAYPNETYSGKGWSGMADWLGKNR